MKAQVLILLVFAITCNCGDVKNDRIQTMAQDPHSFSSPIDATVTHLVWDATIDFTSRTIHATAQWHIHNKTDSDVIIFDTKDLEILRVTLDEKKATEFKMTERDSLLGQGMAVLIDKTTKTVEIEYRTSSHAEALQWLDPSQTAGKKFPFLFTQSQAILARSWVPCQDTPGVRFTYSAKVKGPKELLVLMSASNPTKKNVSGLYEFAMNQPIPSYLLALTAGDVEFQPVSERSGIYAEPSIIEKARNEFADLEKMIAGAEELYGPYRWDRYDVIVLPPSFPFGGMENPRLTFATPTILAGDRSLTSLIAHELAHSWSGNLVTNATWNDFWLNEGFTVYFEHRIMERLYGREYSEMLATLALQDLHETIDDLNQKGMSEDTRLKLTLEGRNPDEGVTDIAYNKGYFFLRTMEEKYGREKFDGFLNDYFSQNAFRSITTDRFISYIKNYYKNNFSLELPETLFQEWIFSEGLPSHVPTPSSSKFLHVKEKLEGWRQSHSLDTTGVTGWSTHEWLHFLKNLPPNLSLQEMRVLDGFGSFTSSGNAEIQTAWFTLAIKNNYKEAYPKMEDFLLHTGRRKFLLPLYNELLKTAERRIVAQDIYKKARPNYHFVATNTFDKLLN